ncbi:MAG TPA: Zn-ribbon domain-containing OB-fold protein [Syntrophorhabdaceae bacterium]|nr:Zn-ribbon domain-containing OB-fold protein [Syntrophorhabdaceae bacterium]HOL05826.1 Zn-ribbon domain-containing OB-fold protein [Syntrophorhabdaceae bacterium]HON86326.1 Zn-ribbon domain-containing OB-fold protein [Syntrophorhabdaceae bacterium]HOT42035.1 Zn-ribbon domain-containing OB-fold protein [Syntrophorhabdaceae bacterium]HPC67086.1 Zn-ribbon domain-containing OB-fold protein [Syntrophorhabdaceae bacterium]
MGFEKFGRKSFTGMTKTAKFVDLLAEGKIEGTVCKQCGAKYFPPRADCAACLSKDMDWFEMPKKGKLETYTIAYYAPYGFEKDCPYTMGVVEYDGGLKLFARLSGDLKPEDIKVGMDVSIRPIKYEDGQLSFEITKA